MNKEKIIVALGGNAITGRHEKGDIHQQFANTRRSMVGVIEILKQDYNMVITHGNGPQVGNALIRIEESRHVVPTLPLGIVVADLEGGMGYMIQQCLENKLYDMKVKKEVVTILTQVLVKKDDPVINNPTKFVGPFYNKEDVEILRKHRGWIMKEDKGRGYRRVVASPKPIGIVEKNTIKLLVEMGIVVIAAGGGGIPVYVDDNGWLEGVDGVIDKDLASAVLGNEIGAKKLIILTAIDKVAINFNEENQQFLDKLSVFEAEKLMAEGQFPAGSMGPKVQAAINFIKGGGEEVVITSIDNAAKALKGNTGTRIIA
jgi:carbamate kinase